MKTACIVHNLTYEIQPFQKVYHMEGMYGNHRHIYLFFPERIVNMKFIHEILFLCRYAVWILILVPVCKATAQDKNVAEELQALSDTNKFGPGGIVHFHHLFNALSKDTIPCDNPQTQAEMNACSFTDYKEADAELNKVYREVMAKLNNKPKRRNLLKKAELAWIKFRDAQSEYEASEFWGGSMSVGFYFDSLASITKERIEELTKDIKNVPENNSNYRVSYKEADAELNRVYKDVMFQLTKEERKRKKLLKTAELAWIKYRDAQSEFEAFEVERGSKNKEIYLRCLTLITVSRTEELKKERRYLQSLNNLE